MSTTFNIYFSDLKPEAQQELLDAANVKSPEEMNWDADIIPLAVLCFEEADA